MLVCIARGRKVSMYQEVMYAVLNYAFIQKQTSQQLKKYISSELNVFSVAKGKRTALVSRHIVHFIHHLCKFSQ